MKWDSDGGVPHDVFRGPSTSLDWDVEMTAVEATGENVEYYFQCTNNDLTGVYPMGFSSGWQVARTWRVYVGRPASQQGLRFRVKARDAGGNATGWSSVEGAVSTP